MAQIHKNKSSITCLLILLLLFVVDRARPCSMFKITIFGKTMVGNNEDAWRENSRIWFETGKSDRYGAAFVGHDDGFPQGGFNEAGLVYDGFAVYRRTLRPAIGKKKVDDFGGFLKSIIQRCATVQEVQHFVNQYDRSICNGSMILFVDKNGDYLVVEADTTILGHDSKYVLSNFCPSVTPNTHEVKIERYQKGVAFLQNKEDTSLRFCTAMMDTMHECRAKIGDGTTYTSIYDLKEKLIYLYFYHDYGHGVTFDLVRELAKGDHHYLMSDLFPPNSEYIRFTRFKTPFNSRGIFVGLCFFSLYLLFSLPCFLLIYSQRFRPKISKYPSRRYHFVWLVLAVMNLALAYYSFNLLTNKAIFYFTAPYTEPGRWLLNLSSYFPTGLLVLFIPLTLFTALFCKVATSKVYLSLFLLNALSYGIMLCLFAYWGLFIAS